MLNTIPCTYNFDEAMALMKQGKKIVLANSKRTATIGDGIRPSNKYKVIYCGQAYTQKYFRSIFGPGAKYENKEYFLEEEWFEYFRPEQYKQLLEMGYKF